MIRLIRFLITGDWRLPPQVKLHRHKWERTDIIEDVWGRCTIPRKLVLRCTLCGDVKTVRL